MHTCLSMLLEVQYIESALMIYIDRLSGNFPTAGSGFSVYGTVNLTLVHIFVFLPLPAPSLPHPHSTETTSTTTILSCHWQQPIVLVVVATWLPHPKNSCLYFESIIIYIYIYIYHLAKTDLIMHYMTSWSIFLFSNCYVPAVEKLFSCIYNYELLCFHGDKEYQKCH